jgi:hypothetical protein
MINILRRIGVAGAMIGLVSAGIAVSATQAQAATCNERRSMQLGGSYIQAAHWRYCFDPDSFTYLTASIEKLVGGQWTLVAQGTGYAYYYCVGTTPTYYRGNITSTQLYNCG